MNAYLLALVLMGSTADQIEAQPEPTWYEVIDLSMALGVGQTTDQTQLTLDGVDTAASQTNLVTFLEVGAQYPLAFIMPPVGHLEGRTRLRFGLQLADGRIPLGVGQDGLWVIDLSESFAFVSGGSLGVRIDLTETEYTALTVGLPLGFRWGGFELLYRPAIDVALASTSQSVLGGERTDGARTGLRWFTVTAGLSFDL